MNTSERQAQVAALTAALVLPALITVRAWTPADFSAVQLSWPFTSSGRPC